MASENILLYPYFVIGLVSIKLYQIIFFILLLIRISLLKNA